MSEESTGDFIARSARKAAKTASAAETRRPPRDLTPAVEGRKKAVKQLKDQQES